MSQMVNATFKEHVRPEEKRATTGFGPAGVGAGSGAAFSFQFCAVAAWAEATTGVGSGDPIIVGRRIGGAGSMAGPTCPSA